MNLNDLYKDLQRWIDVREQISREIRESQAAFGQNTRRRDDRIRKLEDRYDQVQQKILEIDRAIRTGERQASNNFNA